MVHQNAHYLKLKGSTYFYTRRVPKELQKYAFCDVSVSRKLGQGVASLAWHVPYSPPLLMPAVWCEPDQWQVTANVCGRASQEAGQRKPDVVLRSKQSGGSLLELPLRCDTVRRGPWLIYHNWARRLAC